jgi:hypothetical protein
VQARKLDCSNDLSPSGDLDSKGIVVNVFALHDQVRRRRLPMKTELGGVTAVWVFQRDDRPKAALMLPGARYVHHGEVTKFSRVRAARTIGHASAPKFGAEKSAYRSGRLYMEKPWEFKEGVTSSHPPSVGELNARPPPDPILRPRERWMGVADVSALLEARPRRQTRADLATR